MSASPLRWLPVLASILLCAGLLPQAPPGDESPPLGLTIVVVDVGQGDGLLIRTPNGRLHVVDGGPGGRGTAAMLPAIKALAPTSYGLSFLTHWHPDHSGGLDEVVAAHPFTDCHDRGDVNRPTYDENAPYLAAVGARRRGVSAGQVFQLGGGVTATVVAVNGQIQGGASVTVAGQNQEENARSIALRVEYGHFSLWLGGDLTGGGVSGGSATPDVETKASLACGDVDVYHVNHHGSITSTSAALIANLAPELAVVSCGAANPYGHPSNSAVNRINQAAAARVLWSTTAGTGTVGFGAAGTITITSDGTRYRVTARSGRYLEFLCDELGAATPAPGELVVSELQRQPLLASEAKGEYLEVTNVGAAPASLRGLRVVANGGSFTIVTNLLAHPGRPLLLQAHGDPATNGGAPLGFVWPYQALPLGNTSDTVRLELGSTTLDRLAFASGFAGGAGVAAERVDLLATTSPAAFAPAVSAYGLGGKGSPGARNPGDASAYRARVSIEPSLTELVLRASDLAHGSATSVVALAFGSTPGFSFLGAAVPLNADPLFVASLALPGFVAPLPAEGYRSLALALPQQSPIRGYRAYASHVVLDLAAPRLVAVSTAVPFTFP